MNTRTKSLIICIGLVISYGLGRYTSPKPAITTSSTEQENDSTTKVHTVTVVLRAPDGTVKTTKTSDSTEKATSTKNSAVVQKDALKTTKTNISLLAAIATDGNIVPRYGIAVSRELLGPITVGAFGLNNGILGLSIGINF